VGRSVILGLFEPARLRGTALSLASLPVFFTSAHLSRFFRFHTRSEQFVQPPRK
jgi:hypothetical protein